MIGNISIGAVIRYPGTSTLNYEKHVVAVSRLVELLQFLVVARGLGPRTVTELVAYAKDRPGRVRYGSVGLASYSHVDAALFAKRAGLQLTHVPNKKGASGVIDDLLGGRADIAFLSVASVVLMIKAGRLQALAVVNDRRLPSYRDVPTMGEAGYPGTGTLAWHALFAPASTPKDILGQLHGAIVKAMKVRRVVDAFDKRNFRPVPNGIAR